MKTHSKWFLLLLLFSVYIPVDLDTAFVSSSLCKNLTNISSERVTIEVLSDLRQIAAHYFHDF